MKRTPGSPTLPQANAQKKAKVDESDGWTTVEKKKSKKVKKTEADQTPRFMYASNEIIKRHRPLGVDELRDLVLNLVADAPPPSWVRIQNASMIPKVVVLLVPGITNDILGLPPLPTSATINPNVPIPIPLSSSLSFISNTFSHACPTIAPGDQTRMYSIHSTFFSGPMSSSERKKLQERREASERQFGSDPSQFLLSLEQMIENEYPVPSYMADVFQKSEGWVETPEESDEAKKLTTARKIYALDCEMCLTEDGKVLTRVCVIDYSTGGRLLDELVKPAKPILDYLTRWSGITAEALASVTTTHAEVQARIYNLLTPPSPNPFSTAGPSASEESKFRTPILLGHSLESDLFALKISHPYVIDTALLFHHPRGRPLKPGLAWLTKKWLGKEIQTKGDGGHDPEEDAGACVELVQKKLKQPKGWGEFKVDFESIFLRMARSGDVKSAVVDHGNPGMMHGGKATTSMGCENDEEVIKGLLETIPNHQFVFGRLINLADTLGWITPKAKDSDPSVPMLAPPPTKEVSKESIDNALSTLNTHLATLYASLPKNTAVIIFSGHSDPRPMSQLTARKNRFELAINSGKPSTDLADDEKWTSQHVRDLEDAVERAKRGLCFLGVKS